MKDKTRSRALNSGAFDSVWEARQDQSDDSGAANRRRVWIRKRTASVVAVCVICALEGTTAWAQHGGNPQPMPATALDPAAVPKYVDPLVIPPAIPRASKIKRKGAKNIDYYEIAVRQFQQQILPTPMLATTVWSYGAVNAPATFNYPAFTIEAKWKAPVRVKWRNELVKDPIDCFHTPGGPVHANSCDYLPHLLPVDQTLHWANPGGEPCKNDMKDRDCRTNNPDPYLGPVPMIVHGMGPKRPKTPTDIRRLGTFPMRATSADTPREAPSSTPSRLHHRSAPVGPREVPSSSTRTIRRRRRSGTTTTRSA